MKKRVLAMVLVLVLVAGVLPMTASASSGGQKTAEVAVKYFIQKANASAFGFDADWCGYFLYYCANEAGEGTAMGGYAGQVANVYNAANWFAANSVQFGVFSDAALNDIRNHGGYNVNSSHRMNITDYKPQIGDVVFYDWSSYGTDIDHVEIVTDYGSNSLYSIGGNRGNENFRLSYVNGQSCALDTTSKPCAITAFARPKYSDVSISTTPTPEPPSTPMPDGPAKTQYRYHRYEDNSGEYAVCAYWGNVTYNTTMHIAYTDWLDAPLPEVKQGYVNFLEHPNQGASCANAGCLPSDPFEVHRHVDANGKVWYYEETRTVTDTPASTPTPTPTSTPTPTPTPKVTPTPTPVSTPSVTPSETVTPSATSETVTPSAEPPATSTPPSSETKLPLPTTRAYVPDLFWDVKGDDWFYGNVADAYAMGLMNGTGASTFSPGNNMTVAEAVTLAARIHSLYHTGGESFPRYDGGNWYDPYVNYARENNIISENYSYTRPATREEFVHILARALPEEELENIAGTVSFADSRDITYMADVRLLSGAGVINGIPENGQVYFKPLSTITRAEVAAVVARMARPGSRVGG